MGLTIAQYKLLWMVDQFAPYLSLISKNKSAGCGASALATLTGIDPKDLVDRNPYAPLWPDQHMTHVLRKAGVRYKQLPIEGMMTEDVGTITRACVLLMSQWIIKHKTSSWLIWYDNMTLHNWEIEQASPLTLINFPIRSCYMIYKPEWQSASLRKAIRGEYEEYCDRNKQSRTRNNSLQVIARAAGWQPRLLVHK